MKAALPFLALAAAACAATLPGRATPTAALGETAIVDGLRVRPVAIVEDSRCPASVTCVWAGRLVVRTEIAGGRTETRNLELGEPQPVAGGTLVLASATPAKLEPGAIDPGAYRFTFRFHRR